MMKMICCHKKHRSHKTELSERKRRFHSRLFLCLLCFLWLPIFIFPNGDAFANGLYVGDNGPKAMGRGGAFVARPSDPFALYYNPAGLTGLDGRRLYLSLGALIWQPSYARAEDPSGTGLSGSTTYPYGADFPTVRNEGFQPTPLPALFATWQFPWRRLTLGAGFMTPSGPLNLKFPDDGPQRFMIIESTRTESYAMLGAALEVVNNLSIGGVFLLDNVTLELSQAITATAHPTDSPAREGLARLDTSAFGEPSGIAGIQYAGERLSLGLSYQRGADVDLTGRLNAASNTQLNYLLGMSMFGEQPVSINTDKEIDIRLALPHVLRSGVGWDWGRFYSELNVNYWWWSRFKEFRIVFDDPAIPIEPPITVGVGIAGIELEQSIDELNIAERVIPQRMKNTVDLRLGGEYEWSDSTDLRAGLFYQPGAVVTNNLTPLTQDGHTFGLAGGLTRRFGPFHLDATVAGYAIAARTVRESEITAFNGLVGSDPQTLELLEIVLGYDIEDPVIGNGTFRARAFQFFLGAGYEF